MRRAANVDANQTEIVKGLRSCGVTVQVLSMVGKGCPDLLCGFRGQNYLLEVKNDLQVMSKQKLTIDERCWHDSWSGQVHVVNTFKQAMDVICGVTK